MKNGSSGKTLRSAINRGNSLQEAAMKSTKTKVLGGLADRTSAENLLEAEAKAEISVAEQVDEIAFAFLSTRGISFASESDSS